MTNERFEFNDGKLHWKSDEDTLIIDSWPSLKCQYIQGTACESNDNPDSLDTADCKWRTYKSLNRLLYPPRLKLILGWEYPDFTPDDPRYYLAPGYADRILRKRIQPVVEKFRPALLAFYKTFPAVFLDEIEKYEVENARIARAFAIDIRLYDLSVTYPALFLLLIIFAYHDDRYFWGENYLLKEYPIGCFCSNKKAGNPELFLNRCAELNPIEILQLMGRSNDAPLILSRLCKYKRGTSLVRYLRNWIDPLSFFGVIFADKTERLRVCDQLGELHAECLVSDETILDYSQALLESVAGQHPYNSLFSTEWFVRMVYECRMFNIRGVPGLSDEALEQCKSFPELRHLYRIGLEHEIGDEHKLMIEWQISLPVNTPSMRPIETLDEFRAASSEALYPALSYECIDKGYKLFRLLSPVKGILVFRDYDFIQHHIFNSHLYLDYGAEASYEATYHIWSQACRESDWSGVSEEVRQRIMGQVFESRADMGYLTE